MKTKGKKSPLSIPSECEQPRTFGKAKERNRDEREKNATTTHQIEWKREIKWNERKKTMKTTGMKSIMFGLRWFLDFFDDRFYPNVFFFLAFRSLLVFFFILDSMERYLRTQPQSAKEFILKPDVSDVDDRSRRLNALWWGEKRMIVRSEIRFSLIIIVICKFRWNRVAKL